MNPVVTISGGGIIGNYISLRLNQNSIESVVIEKSKNKISTNKNIRTVTLNPYSKKLLDDVGIKIPYAKIKKINVFDGEGTGSIDFSSDEINEENLSFVVYFNDLEDALKRNVLKKTFFETEIKNFKENNNGKCEITLSNDQPINSIFLAGCDGRNSNVAKLASLKPVTSNYEQTAITFTASANLKNAYTAYQIFSERGIFAIMPLPSSNDQSFYTIVWSVDNLQIEEQSIENFIKENISYFEKKLKANIKINSDILSFSLSNHHFENM